MSNSELCKIEGCECESLRLKIGLCSKHYRKWSLYGNPLAGRERRKHEADQKCEVNGCEEEVYSQDFCIKHYDKWWKYGDPLAGKEHHGMFKTKEWQSWMDMKNRCYNSNSTHYKNYGGRGIKVCERWLDERMGFPNFLADMGKKPSLQHTLERCDNDGNYEPGNCKWATRIEQNRNTRTNIIHSVDDANKMRDMWNDGVPIGVIIEVFDASENAVRAVLNNKTWKT